MKKVNLVLINSFFTNLFIVVLKMISGIIGHSNALIADAIHSLSDFFTDIVSIVGNKISVKKANDRYPYGYGKIEYLTSALIGLTVLILGISMLLKAFNSDIGTPSNIVLYASLVAIIIKFILSKYILQKGYQYKSNILIASGIESRSDCLTSLFVILSALLSKLIKVNDIFKYSDNLCTLIIGLYIIYTSYHILKDNISNLIGKNEDNLEFVLELRKRILENRRIEKIINLNLIKYGSYYVSNLEIGMNYNIPLKEIDEIINELKKKLCNPETNISYITVSVKEV